MATPIMTPSNVLFQFTVLKIRNVAVVLKRRYTGNSREMVGLYKGISYLVTIESGSSVIC